MANRLLKYLVVLFLILTISQSLYLVHLVYSMQPQERGEKLSAAASGVVSFCLNDQPQIVVPCANFTDQGEEYACQLNVSDSDNSQEHNFSVQFSNFTLFSMPSNGNILFTPNNSHIGNHTMTFFVQDNSGCVNNNDSQIFRLEIADVNDPPFLSQAVPDVSFNEDEVISAFFLNNHFTDPDGDALTYTVSGENEADITIFNSSEVRITSDSCDFQDVVIFTAKDPLNLTAQSNEVTVSCISAQGGTTTSTTSSGGGGGGGGGGLCRSDFICYEHRACNVNNTKINKCVDQNGCKDEELITVECNYEQEQRTICSEDWLCADWGECLINGTQTRDCIDTNQCGTDFDKPETVQLCTYIPTCDDGVKNGNETGVDCGGNCPACKTIESPAPIQGETSILTSILLWLLIVFLLGTLAFRQYRREIYQTLAKLGLHFAGRVQKQVLFGEKLREMLLQKISRIENNYSEESLTELTRDYVQAAKSYFFLVLGLEIDSDKEDLLATCEERKLNEHLTRVLASFFDKTLQIEFSPGSLEGYELMYLVEELRELILETSDYDTDILASKITEYSISDTLYDFEKMHLKLVNAYIALHFNHLETAVEKYMEILEFYEGLSVQQQDSAYEDIARLYQKIRYRAAWIENIP